MPTLQYLKKKLRGIRSTEKLSKAMKTAATVKYSRLSTAFSEYTEYEQQCRKIYEQYGSDINAVFPKPEVDAAVCFIVIGSNKGMCGSFNAELCSFAENEIRACDNAVTFLCGKQLCSYFTDKKLPVTRCFEMSDTPSHSQADELFAAVYESLSSGSFRAVKIIYPQYKNMMTQIPICADLFTASDSGDDRDMLFIPDKQTVVGSAAKTVIFSLLFSRVLETALGAQAATLMTMRSAYDTANKLCVELEAEINRKRQSRVTADVLETSAEFSEEGGAW